MYELKENKAKLIQRSREWYTQTMKLSVYKNQLSLITDFENVVVFVSVNIAASYGIKTVITTQWWILGEANEAVGPPSKIAHTVSICCRCFLEVIMKSGRKVGNTEIDSR